MQQQFIDQHAEILVLEGTINTIVNIETMRNTTTIQVEREVKDILKNGKEGGYIQRNYQKIDQKIRIH